MWPNENHNVKVSQATVYNVVVVDQSAKIPAKSDNVNLNAKCQRTIKYSEMEQALIDWFKANQEQGNLSGALIRDSGTKILDCIYPEHGLFEFSNAQLDSFQTCHGICSFCHFGKSGSVDIDVSMDAVPAIKGALIPQVLVVTPAEAHMMIQSLEMF